MSRKSLFLEGQHNKVVRATETDDKHQQRLQDQASWQATVKQREIPEQSETKQQIDAVRQTTVRQQKTMNANKDSRPKQSDRPL